MNGLKSVARWDRSRRLAVLLRSRDVQVESSKCSRPERWDDYLGYARLLRPELEQIDGFVDNVRYRSLTREGWLVSLSGWRDEKALVRWRTQAMHHERAGEGPRRGVCTTITCASAR